MQQKNLRLHGAGAAGFWYRCRGWNNLADCDFFGLKIREKNPGQKMVQHFRVGIAPPKILTYIKDSTTILQGFRLIMIDPIKDILEG